LSAILAAILLYLSACANPAASPSQPSQSSLAGPAESSISLTSLQSASGSELPVDVLRVGIAEISGIYDPWFASTVYDIYPQNLLFDYLIGFDENGMPVPEMASFAISKDGLVYTFALKDGLMYSDNTPVKAQDFAFALTIYADPAYDGYYDFSTLGIIGYDDYQKGDADAISGIETPDEKTLVIRLERPSLSAIYSMALPATSRNYYGDNYKKGELGDLKEKVKMPLGSGQYVIEQIVPNQSLSLTANKLHYRGAPKIEKCVFSVTPAGMELERLILKETDIECSYAEPEYIRLADTVSYVKKHIFPYSGFGYIGLNNEKPVFADALTRRALTCAIDRKGVTSLVYGENADVIHAPVSKISWAYDVAELDEYSFDLNRAAELFLQAGWRKNGSGLLERDGVAFDITFTMTPDNPVSDALALVMQDSFSKLGIEFKTQTVDFNTMYDRIFDGSIDMWFGSLGFIADPSVQPLYHTEGYQNFGYYSNPTTDALIEKIDGTDNPDEAKVLYASLWKHLNEELPAIFLYQRDEMWVSNTRVEGLTIDSYNDFFRNLYRAEIKQ
jgi:peptide/nickel transport system substrate-binding protein